DDLAHLDSDGTIRLEPESVQEQQNRDAELMRVYRPQRQDDNGVDYDLRPTMEDIMKAGGEEVPLELKDQVRPGPPKYDPVTGELVRPMSLQGGQYARVIPIPPQPTRTLHYARPSIPANDAVAFWSIPGAMLRPIDLIVPAVIFFVHLLNLIVWIPL